jgi:hypothetical protein
MQILENSRNEAVTVGAASVLVEVAKFRREIILTNTSTAAQNITISFGTPAQAGRGVVLTPYAVYYANPNQDFSVWSGEIFAIASAAGGTLSVFSR